MSIDIKNIRWINNETRLNADNMNALSNAINIIANMIEDDNGNGINRDVENLKHIVRGNKTPEGEGDNGLCIDIYGSDKPQINSEEYEEYLDKEAGLYRDHLKLKCDVASLTKAFELYRDSELVPDISEDPAILVYTNITVTEDTCNTFELFPPKRNDRSNEYEWDPNGALVFHNGVLLIKDVNYEIPEEDVTYSNFTLYKGTDNEMTVRAPIKAKIKLIDNDDGYVAKKGDTITIVQIDGNVLYTVLKNLTPVTPSQSSVVTTISPSDFTEENNYSVTLEPGVTYLNAPSGLPEQPIYIIAPTDAHCVLKTFINTDKDVSIKVKSTAESANYTYDSVKHTSTGFTYADSGEVTSGAELTVLDIKSNEASNISGTIDITNLSDPSSVHVSTSITVS